MTYVIPVWLCPQALAQRGVNAVAVELREALALALEEVLGQSLVLPHEALEALLTCLDRALPTPPGKASIVQHLLGLHVTEVCSWRTLFLRMQNQFPSQQCLFSSMPFIFLAMPVGLQSALVSVELVEASLIPHVCVEISLGGRHYSERQSALFEFDSTVQQTAV